MTENAVKMVAWVS